MIFGFFALKVDSNDSTNFKIHKKEYPIRLGQTFSQFLTLKILINALDLCNQLRQAFIFVYINKFFKK